MAIDYAISFLAFGSPKVSSCSHIVKNSLMKSQRRISEAHIPHPSIHGRSRGDTRHSRSKMLCRSCMADGPSEGCIPSSLFARWQICQWTLGVNPPSCRRPSFAPISQRDPSIIRRSSMAGCSKMLRREPRGGRCRGCASRATKKATSG